MHYAIRALAVAVALLSCSSIYTQTSSTGKFSSDKSSGASDNSPSIVAELTTPLDSRKLKPGGEVEARTLTELRAGNITLPRYSRVLGHVTETTARSKGDASSSLTIAFDKIIPPGGEATQLKIAVLALAPDPDGARGGHADYSDTGALRPDSVPPSGGKSVPLLNDGSRGVSGFKNLQLVSDGVLVSSGKEVKLESGTRLLLAVQP